jgi:gentisate 1,2-dioxygenase
MTAATLLKSKPVPAQAPVRARELMEKLNADANKLNIWVRTELNAPAQRPWFTDTGGASGAGQLAAGGRVAANQLKALPALWRWRDYRPFLDRINEIAGRADVSPIKFADRQSILLTNPGLGGRLQVTNTMRCAISIYTPGDVAPAHIHSANASRTILSEHGGYTNVEGERCEAVRGDLILTPNGTWHDHGNDSDTPVIWIDMLDWPLMEVLDCAWVDMEYRGAISERNAKIQKTVHTDGHSGRLYGHGGLRPTFVSHQRGWGHSADAMIHYRGADVREALDGLRNEKGDLYEAIQLQFINPVTGGPVGTVLDYAAQLLRPGEETRFKRETSNTFMVVMDGQGYTEVGGRRFDWAVNDIVVMPNFLWRRHVNTGNDDAVLYTVSDASLMRNIGQYRAQGKTTDGSLVQLVQ